MFLIGHNRVVVNEIFSIRYEILPELAIILEASDKESPESTKIGCRVNWNN